MKVSLPRHGHSWHIILPMIYEACIYDIFMLLDWFSHIVIFISNNCMYSSVVFQVFANHDIFVTEVQTILL